MIVEQEYRPFSVRYLRRVRLRPIYFSCIAVFFVVGTPFELYQSGFGYSIKLVGVTLLLLFAVFFRRARISTLPAIPLAIILLTFVLNTFGEYTDRGLIAISLMTVSLLLGLARSPQWDRDLTFLVRAYLVIHLAALGYSLLMFALFNVVVDPHGALFPHEARAASHGAFARLSGLHNEPGTYAQWTLAALILYVLCSGRLSSSFSIVVACSILFTLSVWAYGAFALFISSVLVWVLTSARRGLVQFAFAWAGLIALVFIPVVSVLFLPAYVALDIVDFFETKLSLETVSGYSKIDTVDYLLSNLERVFLVGEPLSPGLCPNCASPQDSGLGVNSVFYFGLIPALLLFVNLGYSIFQKRGLAFVVIASIMFGWKALVYDPLFWIIIGYALSVAPRNTSSPGSDLTSSRRGQF